MMVKICGITNREDALAAADAGASAIGFNFYRQSPRYIPPDRASRIGELLSAGILKVGVFVNEPLEQMAGVAACADLDIVQLHGDEPPETLPRGLRVWKALRVSAGFDASALDEYAVEAFLLDSSSGGSGRAFDWNLAAGLRHRIVLAGGLDATNVRDAIRAVRPWGVDACSRIESAPGKKDHVRMREFIQAASESV